MGKQRPDELPAETLEALDEINSVIITNVTSCTIVEEYHRDDAFNICNNSKETQSTKLFRFQDHKFNEPY